MEILYEGTWITLTDEQEKQLIDHRKRSARSKPLFERVLNICGFLFRSDSQSFIHNEFEWIAIIEDTEQGHYVWMCGDTIAEKGAKWYDARSLIKSVRKAANKIRQRPVAEEVKCVSEHFNIHVKGRTDFQKVIQINV